MKTASARRVAEKWIQDAIKEPGALHRDLGIPEDETIPVARIKSELAKLKEKDELSASEKTLQRRLNLALTLKKMNKG